MEHYDNVISLGYNCEIANSLIQGKIREWSYPFDWLFSTMWKINDTFKEEFKNFFCYENLIRSKYSGRPTMDKDGGFIYVHNGSYDQVVKNRDYYLMRKENFNRRIDRLITLLKSNSSVLFVRLFNDDKIEEHQEFVKIIKNLYPDCKFKLLVIIPDNKLNFNHIESENIEYISNIKINRFNISELLRNKYILPIHKQEKKHYY